MVGSRYLVCANLKLESHASDRADPTVRFRTELQYREKGGIDDG